MEKKETLQKHPFGRPFLRTTPSPLLWRTLIIALVFQGMAVYCLGEAKLGGFQKGGFPTFFGKGPDCVVDPFETVPCRCCRPRKRKRTNRENPWMIPRQIRKKDKKDKIVTKKDKKGQKDKSGRTSPNRKPPRMNPPCLAALKLRDAPSKSSKCKTDPVRFKWGFREGLLKDKFAFSRLLKSLYLREENCL